MIATYRIFGHSTLVNTDGFAGEELLHNELGLYPKLAKDEQPDLLINYVDSIDTADSVESRNPSLHESLADGFIATMGPVKVQFLLQNGLLMQVNFAFKPRNPNYLWQGLKKLKDIQFLTEQEAIGQIFHELVLLPAAFFNRANTIVHASGILTSNHQTILFGGTGGVGKTSLELELCLRKNCAFVSDDICVVANDGMVHPNLTYPKVYAYSVKGNLDLKKRIFAGRSIIDRLQWKLMSKIGLDKVRRRISPLNMYQNMVSVPSKLDRYIVLSKERTSELKIEHISPDLAAKLNAKVIQSEYGIFFNHIYWHEYNKYLLGNEPLITWAELFGRIESNFHTALKTAKAYKLKIPIDIGHEDFVKQSVEILSTQIDF